MTQRLPPGKQPVLATHVATNKQYGHQFWCYEKDGTFWTLIGEGDKRKYSSFCSLSRGGFDFNLI